MSGAKPSAFNAASAALEILLSNHDVNIADGSASRAAEKRRDAGSSLEGDRGYAPLPQGGQRLRSAPRDHRGSHVGGARVPMQIRGGRLADGDPQRREPLVQTRQYFPGRGVWNRLRPTPHETVTGGSRLCVVAQ